MPPVLPVLARAAIKVQTVQSVSSPPHPQLSLLETLPPSLGLAPGVSRSCIPGRLGAQGGPQDPRCGLTDSGPQHFRVLAMSSCSSSVLSEEQKKGSPSSRPGGERTYLYKLQRKRSLASCPQVVWKMFSMPYPLLSPSQLCDPGRTLWPLRV